MAIVLYSEGDKSETHDGVQCVSGRFEAKTLQRRLDEGWVNDPKKLVGRINKRTKSTPKKITTTKKADPPEKVSDD